jgi:hypothetical protein
VEGQWKGKCGGSCLWRLVHVLPSNDGDRWRAEQQGRQLGLVLSVLLVLVLRSSGHVGYAGLMYKAFCGSVLGFACRVLTRHVASRWYS